jgi:hypothetical protein
LESGLGNQSQNDLRYALARNAYRDAIVRLVDGDLRSAECLIASRQGLFAVNRHSFRLVCHGIFFGLTLKDGHLFAFEACDRPRDPSSMGRIVRFDVVDQHICNPLILCDGLDNGCHQLAFVDQQLVLVDTYTQVLRLFDAAGRLIETIQPVPEVGLARASGNARHMSESYVHMNSIAVVGDHIHILLHNGSITPAKRSEVLIFDRQWRLSDRFGLDGFHCHDVLPYDDGLILYCGSQDGELLCSDGRKWKLTERMTRGLARNRSGVVVGTGDFARREQRLQATGSVIFLGNDMKSLVEIELPAAPTTIVDFVL